MNGNNKLNLFKISSKNKISKIESFSTSGGIEPALLPELDFESSALPVPPPKQ